MGLVVHLIGDEKDDLIKAFWNQDERSHGCFEILMDTNCVGSDEVDLQKML